MALRTVGVVSNLDCYSIGTRLTLGTKSSVLVYPGVPSHGWNRSVPQAFVWSSLGSLKDYAEYSHEGEECSEVNEVQFKLPSDAKDSHE